MKAPFSMLIQWSDEDQVYVVTLPEFGGCLTHGSTYEEAARQGRDALESLIEIYREDGRPLPVPCKFVFQERSKKLRAPARKKLTGSRK